jgi:hypothetical protein
MAETGEIPVSFSRDISALPFRMPQGKILLDYWQSVRIGSAIPKAGDFDPMAIFKLLPDIMILDLPDDHTVRYRLAGTATVERLGYEPRGRNALDIVGDERKGQFYDVFNMVARENVGLLAHYTNQYEGDFLARIESVILPLDALEDHPPRVVMIVNSQEFGRTRVLTSLLHEIEDICIFDLGFGLPQMAA